MSLDTLKRTNSLDKLLGAVQKENAPQEKKSYKDERLWKPELDKSGNGYAVIRFLPAQEVGNSPWAKYWSHGFKGPTGLWYIENSLSSIGKADPVLEANQPLWEQGPGSEGRRLVSGSGPKNPGRKRKLHYVSNILVVSDSENPQNEGKVFLFKYGAKIHNKLQTALQPEFPDEKPMNPFDMWSGANFKLKIRKVEGQRNYDSSEFNSESAISEDDSVLEEIYNSMYDLSEFTDPKNYKSYEELKARLDLVLGHTTVKDDVNLGKQEEPASDPESEPSFSAPEDEPESFASSQQDDDDDDAMSYFKSLAEED